MIRYVSVILGKRKPVSELLNCRSLTAIITAEIIDYLLREKTMYTTTYKGYTGKFEIDFDDNLISGIVIDIKDVITFHSKTIEEAVQCFHESVDDYLEFCQELGEEPNICSKT